MPEFKRLLVVHHTPSPALSQMLDAVLAGTRAEGIDGVQVTARAALAATAVDVLHADAFILGSPVNIGYISGALKHFLDQVYYPTLTEKPGAAFGYYLHGNNDTAGAQRALDAITTGLGWRQVHAPVLSIGEVGKDTSNACWELGATVAASLM